MYQRIMHFEHPETRVRRSIASSPSNDLATLVLHPSADILQSRDDMLALGFVYKGATFGVVR